MPANTTEVEQRLWDAADELRANSRLKSSEYSDPVLGLIFLCYTGFRFSEPEKEIATQGSGRRVPGKDDYQARGVMYVPPAARLTIGDILDKLPNAYTPDIYRDKCDVTYEHIFDSFSGQGHSIYAQVG